MKKTEKVLYEELVPRELTKRIEDCPVAYLPLGTLEWHGEHLPLGSDGIQSQGFFIRLAEKTGGVVLPMLFMGPDSSADTENGALYGMDLWTGRRDTDEKIREPGRLDGSAYWMSDGDFLNLIDCIFKQLQRVGFKIIAAHGHGPSTALIARHEKEWLDKYGLTVINCWGSEQDGEGLGIQVDHAGSNETSLVMALRPELVQMDRLPEDIGQIPVAVSGKDPRIHAGRETGEKIIETQLERMSGIITDILAEIKRRL
ncbi:MAG: creatininase family protein [Oscillospiraceae bacterium]|nr:creatininase family protein [Oscillospiraceae bacterium]